MKTCTKCLIEKELTEYYKNKNTKGGFQYRCKSCGAEQSAAWYAKPENKARLAEQRAKPENKARMTDYGRLKKKTGWSREDFEAALVVQGYKCMLCPEKLDPNVKGPAGINADHCSKQFKPRALLCHSCNLHVVGVIETHMRRAPQNRHVYDYLLKHGSISQEVRDILETLAQQVEKENLVRGQIGHCDETISRNTRQKRRLG